MSGCETGEIASAVIDRHALRGKDVCQPFSFESKDPLTCFTLADCE